MITDPHSLFAIFFFGGMLAELVLLLAFTVKTERIRLWALVMLPALLYVVSLMYSRESGDYTVLLISSGMGVLGVTLLFLPEILPVITRYHVLAYTITFWYALAGSAPGYMVSTFNTFLLVLSAAGAAGALWGQFRPAQSGKVVWTLAYAWYLLALAYIGFSQFSGLDLDFFSAAAASLVRPGPLEALVYGMAFAYVAMSFSMVYLYVIFGYVQKAARVRTDRDKKQMLFLKNLLASKTLDITLEKPATVMVLLGAQLALAALNHWLHLVPRFFLINTFVLVIPYLVTQLLKIQVAPQPSPEI
jgi:hypothetical protein